MMASKSSAQSSSRVESSSSAQPFLAEGTASSSAHACTATSATSGADAPGSLAGMDTLFTHSKAGMDGVDKERVKRIVYEMSKDSPFFKEQERRDARVGEHITACRNRLAKVTTAELSAQTQRADRLIVDIERARSLERTRACVDMDASVRQARARTGALQPGSP